MYKIKMLLNKKIFRLFSYFFLTMSVVALFWSIGSLFNINQFLELVELKTLDLRFNVSNRVVKPNPNIVILSIDDASMENLQDDFGVWPWTRNAYTKVIDYLEKGEVDSIILDMMFIGHQKGFEHLDREFIKAVGNNKNIYVGLNFDPMLKKNPPALPDDLHINFKDLGSGVDYSNFSYPNVRMIMSDLLKSTPSIGITNCPRDKDGINRHVPLLSVYQGKFYPFLAFKAAYDYIERHEKTKIDSFVLDKNRVLKFDHRKIQLDKDGLMMINWYGPVSAFNYISFSDVIDSIKSINAGKKPLIPPEFFKDKVVFVGVTAISQYDIKSTPLSRIYPGVELEATVFNNILDNNPIKRVNSTVDILICIILSLITAYLVIKLRSVFASSLSVIIVSVLYIILAAVLFERAFVWVGIFNQIIVITLTFISMYIMKYLIKLKDFEYTYRLATTDGLTGLYNHRYFQENLENAIKTTNKTGVPFSLIFVDIDFFKKFNDTYGHQAGDIVLKQVAYILKSSVKSTDFVARYGGEEMSIILPGSDIGKALAIADRLCKTVASKRFILSDTVEVGVTISLGVSTYPIHGRTIPELIEFADQGLYRAKKAGRNRVGSLFDVPEPNLDEPQA